MNPVTHFFAGWVCGLPFGLERRDRALIIISSVVPDADGLPVLLDLLNRRAPDAMQFWSDYHHSLHNLAFAAAFSLACAAFAKKRLLTPFVCFAAIHLHYLCDIIGSRGPDGYQWPIPYLQPFSDKWRLAVPWQWELNAWQNVLITAALLAVTLYYAWKRGYSPAGLFSERADGAFVKTLRSRFGEPSSAMVGGRR